MRKALTGFLLLLPALAIGTELKPWLDRDLEVQARGSALFQFYQNVYTPHKTIHHQARDRFYHVSAAFAAFDYSAEVEMTVADTKFQHLDVDCLRLTLRRLFLDDILGDPLTLTAGLTITQAFRHSIFDISSFHHGHIEAEANISFGKETPCMEFWLTRWWGYAGLGIADNSGSPWLHTFFAWERNWWNMHQFRVFMESLIGFGGRNISSHRHFHGYGKIKHRSLDVGARYTYFFDYGESLSLQYAYRPYAYNFPAHANLVLISFLYPFGL